MAMFLYWQTLMQRLRTVSKLLYAFCVMLLLGFALSWSRPFWFDNLTIVPYRFLGQFSIGSIVTFWLIEDSFFFLLLDIACLYTLFTVVQPFWGDREILLFLFSVTTVFGLLLVIVSTVAYSFGWHSLFFDVNYAGFAAPMGAAFVAVKQALPDAVLFSAFSIGQRLKVNHLPFCGLLVLPMLYFFSDWLKYQSYSSGAAISSFAYVAGIIIAWVYLRYFQKHTNGTYGDPSPNFSFNRFVQMQLLTPRITFGEIPSLDDWKFVHHAQMESTSIVLENFIHSVTIQALAVVDRAYSGSSLFPSMFHPFFDRVASGFRHICWCRKYCMKSIRYVRLDEVKTNPDSLRQLGSMDIERQK
ncbi:unnamed protein product [Soboliphyme baturini]|uniref:Rhomboid domain-containing protein n=1 Tax=Soboliphyme baturini TaxID=241478 RepID=A0A183I913_9BILA|nr:unnamed protein product [Soboliphyme baturini]